MDDFHTASGLAFCMDGDPTIRGTKREIARVPLSDYVLTSEDTSAVGPYTVNPSDTERFRFTDDHIHHLRHNCDALLNWQEQQTILLPIDDRFRFRCLLSWLDAMSTTQPKRITGTAAKFMMRRPRDQYELLKAEDESLVEILDSRQEEGVALTGRHMEQVQDLDDELQGVAEAMNRVRELVEMAVKMGLVQGETDIGSESRLAGGRFEVEEGTAAPELGANAEGLGGDSDIKMDPEWQIDTAFG